MGPVRLLPVYLLIVFLDGLADSAQGALKCQIAHHRRSRRGCASARRRIEETVKNFSVVARTRIRHIEPSLAVKAEPTPARPLACMEGDGLCRSQRQWIWLFWQRPSRLHRRVSKRREYALASPDAHDPSGTFRPPSRHHHRPRCRPGAGRRLSGYGRHRPAPRLGRGGRHPPARRQRRGCSGRRRLRPGRRLSRSGQHRRRRLHDPAACRRAHNLSGFPRKGAAGRHCDDVPGQERQRRPRPVHRLLAVHRRARLGRRPGICPRQIRHPAARHPARAGDKIRPRRVCPHSGRRHHFRHHGATYRP